MSSINTASVRGTSYDVQDARLELLDSRVNALHGLVNYGYLGRAPYNGTYAYAEGTRVTSKGTLSSNTVPVFIRLSGNDSGTRYAATYADLRAFSNPITLIDGHVYRFWMIWESGSVTTSQENGIYPGVYASGGDLNIGSRVFVGNNAYVEFTYTSTNYPSGIQLCMVYNRNGGITITNWVANWVLEDVTSENLAYQVSGNTPSIVAAAGVRYICSASYVSSLSFTPSSTGICSVRFVSGTTPTVLTLPNDVVMPDWWTGTEANRTYEISIEDGVYGVVTSWA